MKALLLVVTVIGAAIVLAPKAQAHGGRTDGSGCHRDRGSGDRHCHCAGGGSALSALSGSDSKGKRAKRKKRRR